MSPVLGASILALVWLGTSAAGGAAMALLARRIHPSLSYRRLWIFYTGLIGFFVAVVVAIAWW